MAEKKENNNLELWEAVRTPPEAALKKFKRAGGFSGTAIEPMWLIKKATELWGPIGNKWGIDPESVKDSFIDGSDGSVMHFVRFNVFYPGGTIPAVGQTMFVMKTRHGLVTDEEAPKKSMTDALGWALSRLGFAADVYMGLMDGNKYIHQPSAPEEDGNGGKIPVPQSIPEGTHTLKPLEVRVVQETPNWTMWAVLTDKGEFVTFAKIHAEVTKGAIANEKMIEVKIITSKGRLKASSVTAV